MSLKNLVVTFTPIDCCYENCGRTFAMTSTMENHYRNNKKAFACPYCKGTQGFYGKNEEERLKDKVKMLRDEVNFSNNQISKEREKTKYAKRQTAYQKGVITKIKKRVKHGICPCCNRTFKQLAAHMKNKHPEYMEHKK